MNQYRCETCKKEHQPECPMRFDGIDDLPHDDTESLDTIALWAHHKTANCCGLACHSDYQSEREPLHLSSSDLLLIAHDEWKRREERKHIHEHISWVNGWISGFLTPRKFVQEKVAELRQAGEP